MSLVDDELVEALLANGTHPAFCISIGVRSANWCVDHFDVLCSKDMIEGCGELRVPIME